MHVQEDRVTVVAGADTQRGQAHAGLLFIEGDKLDALDALHQREFRAADHPGDAGIRPRGLDGAQDGQRVAAITDSRQPNDADRLWP